MDGPRKYAGGIASRSCWGENGEECVVAIYGRGARAEDAPRERERGGGGGGGEEEEEASRSRSNCRRRNRERVAREGTVPFRERQKMAPMGVWRCVCVARLRYRYGYLVVVNNSLCFTPSCRERRTSSRTSPWPRRRSRRRSTRWRGRRCCRREIERERGGGGRGKGRRGGGRVRGRNVDNVTRTYH